MNELKHLVKLFQILSASNVTYICSPWSNVLFSDERNGVRRISLKLVQDIDGNHLDPFSFGFLHGRVQILDFTFETISLINSEFEKYIS